MTNTEIIATIRAEIERLKGICTAQIKANSGQTFPFVMEMTGYDKLLSFLSTLGTEQEQPDFPTTNEQVNEFLATHPKVEVPQKYKTPDWIFEKSEKPMQEGLEEEIAGMYQALFGTDIINRKEMLYLDTFEAIARHFAEWQKEQDTKDMYMSDNRNFEKVYELGKSDMKKQMLKEAEEVKVGMHGEPIEITLDKYVQRAMGIYPGGKVRIIVIPNTDEK